MGNFRVMSNRKTQEGSLKPDPQVFFFPFNYMYFLHLVEASSVHTIMSPVLGANVP